MVAQISNWLPQRKLLLFFTVRCNSEQLTCVSPSIPLYELWLIKKLCKSHFPLSAETLLYPYLCSFRCFSVLHVWQNCNRDLGSSWMEAVWTCVSGISNGNTMLLIYSPSVVCTMNNNSSLQYWLLPAPPHFNDYAFVLCGKKSCRKHSITALRCRRAEGEGRGGGGGVGVGGWGGRKAGSPVTSALYYSLGSLSFPCVKGPW